MTKTVIFQLAQNDGKQVKNIEISGVYNENTNRYECIVEAKAIDIDGVGNPRAITFSWTCKYGTKCASLDDVVGLLSVAGLSIGKILTLF